MSKLNFGYGQLNDVSRTNVGPTYNPDTTSGVDSLKNSLETHYSYDIMSGLGSLKGICIGITQLYDKDGGEGWMSRMFSSTKENPRPLLAIKVRIPFLDSMLPDPLNPMDGEPYLDWGIIQLYNTFVAADEEISGDIPSIGDIVRVDYDDRTTRRGGIYLGKVFENPKIQRIILTPKVIDYKDLVPPEQITMLVLRGFQTRMAGAENVNESDHPTQTALLLHYGGL